MSDDCLIDITCRFDEDLHYTKSQTVRWYEIEEEKPLFYITRTPIPVENLHKLEDSQITQTFYNQLIEDGSD